MKLKVLGKYTLEKLYEEFDILDSIIGMYSDIFRFEQDNLCFITLMKGGEFTANNLFSFMDFTDKQDPIFGHIGLTSYAGSMEGSKHVKITSHLDLNLDKLEGRNVWLIDDITDRGLTMEMAKKSLVGFGVNTVKTAVLIDKKYVRESYGHAEPDVVGISHGHDDFLVGCGMGIGEKFRYLKDLWKVIKE